ncbi:MarR family transcriptional regulator [Streptomyces sp. NPDC059787]|uniref:helix-turn-helix transcriptional regulator n=1 Tax=Streptomyces sp. NPDC059787 TaxID=3346947 RepID=UPI00365BF05A
MRSMCSASRWTAERYKAEAARRRTLRAERRPLVTDARKALAVARKADPERTKPATHKAERELRKAQRAVPDPMWVFASKAAIVAAVAGYVGLPHVPSAVWLWSAVAVTVAAVGAVVVAVALASRMPKGLVPTAEERQLLKRLAPEHWSAHADGRGLAGTITGRPALTDAGIVADVRLDGTWTVAKLTAAADHVRALLGCRTGLRLEVKTGERGGWAQLILRTRSAVDGADMRWTPDRVGIGLDTLTGEPVRIPLNTRLLLAGSSGAGKSVTLRPALAELAADPKAAVVMVDLKRVEGALWRDRVRVARTADEVIGVAAELQAEMMERLEILESTGSASWTPTVDRPRIVVVVDEGAEVSAVAKDAVADFESLARMGRAAEIHLWWCTQKPTQSGASAGIPPQIAAQMDVRLCLKVATATEVRTVLGEDATAGGWDAHTLPKPGVLMIRGTGRTPAPVKVWFMDDDQVRALPAARIWHGTAIAPVISMRKPPEPPAPAGESTEERVLRVVQDGPARQKDIVEKSGLPKGTVSKVVGRLVEKGLLARLEDGTVAPAGTEATA